MIGGSHLQSGEKTITPFWRECRRVPPKLHGQPDDFADVFPIGLFRGTVVGTMGERFVHNA